MNRVNISFPSWWWILLLLGFIIIFGLCHYIWIYNGGYFILEDGTKTTNISHFIKEYGGLIGSISSIVLGIFPYVAIDIYHKKIEKEDNYKTRKNSKYLWDLSLIHKEKINILEKFDSSIQYNDPADGSIYGTMIEVLNRLKNEPDENVSLKELYVFLCSPVLDTPERIKGNYSEWGREFSGILADMTTLESGLLKDNVNICFLSNEPTLGFKPLQDFVEVLANYCADFDSKKAKFLKNAQVKSSEEINELIYNETKRIYDTILNKHKNNRCLTLLEDIPFQMIITKTDKFAEVVVSFAGKNIIEKEDYIEPKGFHSIDPDVVNAFIDIFKAYTNKRCRIPFKPRHTENIICQTKDSHRINEYHSNTLINILPSPIEIPSNTFSPFYANSSKFTTDALLHILRKDDKVIEIGSGSGIQVLAALQKLKDLKTEKPIVWAIEPYAIDVLKKNCSNAPEIKIKHWILRVDNKNSKNVHLQENDNQPILCDWDKCFTKNKRCNTKCKSLNYKITDSDFDDNKFNIVLGDLPFVSARPKDTSNKKEFAYYDLHHESHQALLRLFKNATWIAQGAILITAFSTLGGYEDTKNFAQMIQKEGLVIVQYFCYLEKEYHWITYCLMKKEDYDAANQKGKDYWKDRFGIKLAN